MFSQNDVITNAALYIEKKAFLNLTIIIICKEMGHQNYIYI